MSSSPLPAREFVLYLRKSKGRTGIARQRQACQAHCDRIGGRVVAEFVDTDRTAFVKVGAGPSRRDDYQAMLDLLRADAGPLPLGVLAWHADRLHRDPGEAEMFLAVCASGRHPVETPRGGSYDLTTPTGRKRFRNDVVDAAYEVDHMIERIESMKVESAMEGRWLGGRRPFGYEADGVTVRQAEAVELQKMAGDLLAGTSLHSIARDLNARNIGTSTGAEWDARAVRRVLLRPRNAGIMEHRGEELGRAEWPAILDEPTWRGVCATLADPERRTSPGPARRWLGSGIYQCGVCILEGEERAPLICGAAGWGAARGHRRTVPSYKCGKTRKHVTRSAVHLDKYVTMVAIEWLSQLDAAELLVSPGDSAGAHARVVEREALRLQEEEAGEMFAALEMTRNQLAATNKRIAARRAELDKADAVASRGNVLTPFLAAHTATIDPDQRRAIVTKIWNDLDLDRHRAVVNSIMRVVVLPAGRGKPKGWTPEHGAEWGYFDSDTIRIEKAGHRA
jgi:DNA invertase Pin-like site-specific DNA recombinase